MPYSRIFKRGVPTPPNPNRPNQEGVKMVDKKSLDALSEGPCEMMADGDDADAVLAKNKTDEGEETHLPREKGGAV